MINFRRLADIHADINDYVGVMAYKWWVLASEQLTEEHIEQVFTVGGDPRDYFRS